MPALAATVLPAFGALVIEYLYKDGESSFHRRKFVIPFRLESRDEYLVWLHWVLLEVQRVFGRMEYQYILTYLRTGKEAAKEWLTTDKFDPTTAEKVKLHCESIAEAVIRAGVNPVVRGYFCYLLKGWRELYWTKFQFNAEQFVTFLTKWGNQRYLDEAKCILNSHKTWVYLQANSFTVYERYFMGFFGIHDGYHEESVKTYFSRLGVTSINLADRVTENFPEDSYIFEASQARLRKY